MASSKTSHPLNPNATPYTTLAAAARTQQQPHHPTSSPPRLPHQFYQRPVPLSAAAAPFHRHPHRHFIYYYRQTSFHSTNTRSRNRHGCFSNPVPHAAVPHSPAAARSLSYRPRPEMGSSGSEHEKRILLKKRKKKNNKTFVADRRGDGSPRFSALTKLTEETVKSGGADMEKEVEGAATSLMIRNIPNHFLRSRMMGYLDRHCAAENLSAVTGGGVLSEYDFLYVPMDFSTGGNLGYAFVNFTTAVAACRFRRSFNDYAWGICNPGKICQISDATIQGKKALVAKFRNSTFRCHRDNYLPLVFDPPRGGKFPNSLGTMVGQCLPRPFPRR